MKHLRAMGAALVLALASSQAAAQAPEQSLEQIQRPAELQLWSDILRLVTQRIAHDRGVYSVPDNDAEAVAARARLAAARADGEAQVALLVARVDADRESGPETLDAQRRALARINELGRFTEATRLQAVAGEIEISMASRLTVFAMFREANLITAEMASAAEAYLAPGSFEFAWNRAFEITQRVGALELEIRVQILRGGDHSAARQAMAVLATQTRALAPIFAEATELDARQRVRLSQEALRHADVLDARPTALAALTPEDVAAEPPGEAPALINDLSDVVASLDAPL